MATWITHIRIAEILLEKYDFDRLSFIAGNVGPDSGVLADDGSGLVPPKVVTHWLPKLPESDTMVDGRTIEADKFFDTYLGKRVSHNDYKRYSYLFGYYVHLLVDMNWSSMHREMIKVDADYGYRIFNDRDFISEVKKDWYGLDFRYIRENDSNIFTNDFMSIPSVEDYLDYFPKGGLNNKVEYIKEFYLTRNNDYIPTDRYFTMDMMNDFVKDTAISIDNIIESKYHIYNGEGD